MFGHNNIFGQKSVDSKKFKVKEKFVSKQFTTNYNLEQVLGQKNICVKIFGTKKFFSLKPGKMLPGPIFDQNFFIPKRFDTKTSLGQNSDLQAGIWFGNVAPSPIITIPHSLWFSCPCLKSCIF